ncbi:LysR family transcriptional regulator [Alteromonas confluentis]|uniref:HTH lysR-type domain-containing protein n=1 Tax=Alteromonas confluentis TaxID=1656094 RepID=A0A1E7Z6H4_9ALTE|nr:LysR family transcriptional regulator [Alteromonas confluentis]OFC69143.1 hypothetical protein BFC18_20660 [Alteromonas confluentis]
MVNIKHLKAFLAVATELHFTRAAERVCLTQPALSTLIQQLEQEFGIQLVRRHTRQVELTPAGAEFKETAEKLVGDFEQALYDVKTYKSVKRGRLDIAVLPSVCSSLMPKVLKQFNVQYPDIKLNVMDCAGYEIIEALNEKRIDFGICYAQSDKEIEATTLIKDSMVVVCPAHHALATKSSVMWKHLANQAVIAMDKGTTIRTIIDSTALSLDMKLDIVLEPKQMTSALAYVQNEIGVAILPSSGVPDKLPDSLKAIALINPSVERNISILRRRGIALSPAASAMRQLLLDAVG